MPFDYHPDPDLRHAYPGYQGQHPARARCIFLGFDPNFPTGEDWRRSKPTFLEYLDKGPAWCIENNRHHPMAPAQGQERLTDYHNVMASLFSRLTNLGVDRQAILEKVSFVDLLGKPTKGCRNENRARYRRYLKGGANLIHLHKMCQWFAQNSDGLLIVPRWVLDDALGALLRGNCIIADIRCSRTIIVRQFPYFHNQSREFRKDSLTALATTLHEHWHH